MRVRFPLSAFFKIYIINYEDRFIATIVTKDIHFFEDIASTMFLANNFDNIGCYNYNVVVAEQQYVGRGRIDRIWYSYIGGLYFSVLVHINIPFFLSSCVGFTAALVMVDVIWDLFGVEAYLKWPNDIYVCNKKIGGILTQTKLIKNKTLSLNLGIGLNLNNDIDLLDLEAISVFKLLKYNIIHDELLLNFLDRFRFEINNFMPMLILKKWSKKCITLGNLVTIKNQKKNIEGVAIGIHFDGGLEILLKNGYCNKVLHGDCHANRSMINYYYLM